MAGGNNDKEAAEWAYDNLAVSDIPEKLRCANCNKLAVNAVKLPCCDSSICSYCQDSLQESECPVCSHSPFDASLAIQAKSLQATVKAFVRKTKLSLKSAEAAAAAKAAPAPTPDTKTDSVTEAAHTQSANPPAADDAAVPTVQQSSEPPNADGDAPNEDEPRATSNEPTTQEPDEADDDGDDDDGVVITLEHPAEEAHEEAREEKPTGMGHGEERGSHQMQRSTSKQGMHQQQQNFGFDPTAMNGFNNANYGDVSMNMNMNGFNPMMMQNFAAMGMGMPNMMSMQGMGMDPSMMFGGMGDMNMMGMNGMGSNYGGMNGMGGNFGNMQGFFPSSSSAYGSYSQSNYGGAPQQQQRQNTFQNGGYNGGVRGNARGAFRGGRGNFGPRGRGFGYNAGFQQQQHHGQHQHQHEGQSFNGCNALHRSGANADPLPPRRRSSPTYDATAKAINTSQDSAIEGQDAKDNQTNAKDQDTDSAGIETNAVEGEAAADVKPAVGESVDMLVEDASRGQEGDAPEKIPNENQADLGTDDGRTIDIQENAAPVPVAADMPAAYEDSTHTGYDEQHAYNGNNIRGGFRGGRNYYRAQESVITELTPTPAPAVVAPPINAPTGPKAMRQGLPNTGWAGRALQQKQAAASPPVISPQLARNAVDRERSAEFEHKSREERRAAHENDDDYESDETYNRRKERERRKRKEKERGRRHADEEQSTGGSRDKDRDEQRGKYPSRSDSPGDSASRRHSHRDKDKDGSSRRDKSRDRRHRRHRSRTRSRSPARENDDDDHTSRRKSTKSSRDHGDDGHKSSRRASRRDDKYDEDYALDDRRHSSAKHGARSRGEERYDSTSAAPDKDLKKEPFSKAKPQSRPPAIDEELGFKIKGSQSAKAAAVASGMSATQRTGGLTTAVSAGMVTPMALHARAPGGAGVATGDPYAAERARAQADREKKEASRRQGSSGGGVLGKRGREGGEDGGGEVPRGPRGERDRGRKSRRMPSVRYEDEV